MVNTTSEISVSIASTSSIENNRQNYFSPFFPQKPNFAMSLSLVLLPVMVILFFLIKGSFFLLL